MPNIVAAKPVSATVRILCVISCLNFGGMSLAESPTSEEARGQEPPRLELETDQRVDLNFPTPTALDQIYSALGQIFQLGLVMDPQLKPKAIKLRLHEVNALEALEAVTRAAGHLFSPLGPRTAMIADNTPEMRRSYEHQALKTFQLEHASLKQVGAAIRSVLGLKRVAFDEENRRITIRDSPAKLELAQVLVETLDLPRAEFDVDLEWLLLTPADAPTLGEAPSAKTQPGSMEITGTGRILLTEIESAKRRRHAQVLDRATVSLMAGEIGHHRLTKTLLGPRGEPSQELRLKLHLDLDTDDETECLSLWMKATSRVTAVGAPDTGEDREIASNFHLEKGFGFWMGRLGEARHLSVGETNTPPSKADGPLEIAVVVRARVVRPAPVTALDHRMYWTGSEAQAHASGTGTNKALRTSDARASSGQRSRFRPAPPSQMEPSPLGLLSPQSPAVSLSYLGTVTIDQIPKAILSTPEGVILLAAANERIQGFLVVEVGSSSVQLARESESAPRNRRP